MESENLVSEKVIERTQKPIRQLYDWEINTSSSKKRSFLFGKAINDPRFVDGHRILTSSLLSIDFEKMEAETMNTVYKLLLEDPRGTEDIS